MRVGCWKRQKVAGLVAPPSWRLWWGAGRTFHPLRAACQDGRGDAGATCLARGAGGFHWRGALVIAFLIRTRDYRAGFEILFDQEFVSATGALLGDRLIGGREL